MSNSLSHFENADRIVVLKDGRIKINKPLKSSDENLINLKNELINENIVIGKSDRTGDTENKQNYLTCEIDVFNINF